MAFFSQLLESREITIFATDPLDQASFVPSTSIAVIMATTSQRRPLRIAVAGLGRMGKLHIGNLKKLDDVEIVGVVSRSRLHPVRTTHAYQPSLPLSL